MGVPEDTIDLAFNESKARYKVRRPNGSTTSAITAAGEVYAEVARIIPAINTLSTTLTTTLGLMSTRLDQVNQKSDAITATVQSLASQVSALGTQLTSVANEVHQIHIKLGL